MKYLLVLGIAALIGGSVALYFGLRLMVEEAAPSISLEGVRDVAWPELVKLDFETGKLTRFLKEMNGELVRVPGFAVPLEDDLRKVREFLLVPYAMACIHVPPPPPNQIVQVVLERSVAAKKLWGPIWVTGEIHIESIEGSYGAAGFVMKGYRVEKYQTK